MKTMRIDDEVIRLAQQIYVKASIDVRDDEIDLGLLSECFANAAKIVKASRLLMAYGGKYRNANVADN